MKDLRKTCATYYDEHMPESSIEILGHSVSGVTYRHYVHRAPLAFKAIISQLVNRSGVQSGISGRMLRQLPTGTDTPTIRTFDPTDCGLVALFIEN
ncbi:MAG: hypothetical protein GXP26_00805 [Planctomycetes bacterium]|nr:hypothetical protein [Planctomycetota bacterium]